MKKSFFLKSIFLVKDYVFLTHALVLLGLIFFCQLVLADRTSSSYTVAEENNRSAEGQNNQGDKPKNIIFLIGDGMGVNYLSAYRYFKNSDPKSIPNKSMRQKNTHTHYPVKVKPTVFDQFWVGTSATYPHDDTWVTDSASSATALSSGVKTYNGAIGVDHQQNHLKLLFESAKESGMSTGLAVTSPVTHATPASFFAHHKTREEQAEIADQFVLSSLTNSPLVDVAFGGGWDFFIREDENLIKQLQLGGYEYIDAISNLSALKRAPAIGLFADYGLVSAIDGESNSLAKMTAAAIRLLNGATTKTLEESSNKSGDSRGFVLLVEGSQIDWCGHANDIACAMAEMESFASAFSEAIDFAQHDGNTLVIVTADHETGGLSLGLNGDYGWRAEKIHSIRASVPRIASEIMKTSLKKKAVIKSWEKFCDFKLSESEVLELIKGAESEKAALGTFKYGRGPLSNVVKRIINERTLTGWTSSGHTAGDVPILAYGPGSQLFHGFIDNEDIGKKLHYLLKP